MPSRIQNRIERGVVSRGITAAEAAGLYGISEASFHRKRANGEIPAPTLPCGRYDRVLLERDMDRRSGIDRNQTVTPLDAWRASRGSRQP
jgi:hypothetical protein